MERSLLKRAESRTALGEFSKAPHPALRLAWLLACHSVLAPGAHDLIAYA